MRKELLDLNRYESTYLYHVEANLTALYLCKRDWAKAKEHFSLLDALIPHDYRTSYLTKKHRIISEIITKQDMAIDDPERIIQKYCSSFQSSAWDYFGRLFAFNTLEYWSEA